MGKWYDREGKQKKWIFFLCCLFAVLIFINSKMFYKNKELKTKLIELGAENQMIQTQNNRQAENNHLMEEENYFLEEKEEPVDLVEFIEEKIKNYSLSDLVIRCYPMGEDATENRKRFYVCTSKNYDKYYLKFYFADYLTGEVIWLYTKMSGEIYVSTIEEAEKEYQVLFEDFDGNGMLDILFVLSFQDQGDKEENGRILLWMQQEDQLVAFNDIYCGEEGHEENAGMVFSKQIRALEEQFRREQKPEDWEIERIALWIKEELFMGKEKEVSFLLYPPQRNIPYRERREADDIHVSVITDGNGQYQVSIPEILYSEKKINNWLLEFYQKEAKAEEEFMGIGIKESDTYLTETERIQYGFSYQTSLQTERVDDAVISIFGNTNTYSGGAHGNDVSFSVNFDTKSGEVLALEELFFDLDIFRNKAVDYIAQNHTDYPEWWLGYVREAVWEEQWYLTEDGIVFFLNGINGAGIWFYEVPYEYFANDMKVEYLPCLEIG